MPNNTTFQANAFQWGPILIRAFQVDLQGITDTTKLQLPINGVLMSQQDYEVDKRIAEEHPANPTAAISYQGSDIIRLSKDKPTFTVKSSNRGH